ncbi:23S rRNA (guanosine(2251)-2'-O)-methyltransferase RlmB [Aerococcus viridans]
MARDNQRQQNRDRRPRSTNNEEELDQSPDFVYGFHAAMEVLEGDHDVNKVFLQTGLNEKNAQAILKAANKRNILVSNVPKEKLDTLSDGGNHQGVVMAIAAYKYAELDDIFKKAEEANEDPTIMVLDGIEDPHNLGSILRTADASGVHGVIIQNRRAVGLTQVVAKTSTGAIEHVPVVRVTNISKTIDTLKERGVWVFGTDMKGQSMWQMDATLPIAVVIGNEGKGVSPGVKKHLDGMITIPMRGHVQSLNASVAAGLLMYQIYQSRMGNS